MRCGASLVAACGAHDRWRCAMRCGTTGMPPRCRRCCLAPSPHRGKQLRSLMWSPAVSAGTPWAVLDGPWRRLSQRRAEEAGTVDARLALGRSAALEDHRGGGGSVGRRATARAATPAIRAQQCGAHRLSTKIVDVNTQRVAEAQQGKAAVGPALLPSWFRDRPVVWWMLTEVDGSRGPPGQTCDGGQSRERVHAQLVR